MTFFDGLQQVVSDKIKTFDHVANALTTKVTTEIKKAKKVISWINPQQRQEDMN